MTKVPSGMGQGNTNLGPPGGANGYFSCWLAFIASFLYVMECQPFIKDKVEGAHGGGMIVYAIMCSIVVAGQGIFDGAKGEFTDCHNFAIAVGIISLVFLVALLMVEAVKKMSMIILGFLAFFWFIAVCLLTFTYKDSPAGTGCFTDAGNGFFAIWGAFFLTFALAFEEFADSTVKGDGTEEGEAAAKAEAAETTDPRTFIAAIFVASFFQLYGSSLQCDKLDDCKDENALAVSVGVFSTFTTLVMLVLSFCGFGTDGFHKVFSIFLCVIWVVGAGVTTFKKPFPYACERVQISSTSHINSSTNGYVSTWVALAFSCAYMQNAVEQLKNVSMPSDSSLSILFVASCVLTVQAMVDGDDKKSSDGDWQDALVFATVAGWISILLCVAAKFLSSFAKYIGALLLILWFFITAILTFHYAGKDKSGQYAQAGNGFFACWIGFFSAAMLVAQEFLGGANEGSATDGDASNMDATTAPGIDTKGMDDAAPAAEAPVDQPAPAADTPETKEDEAANV